MNTRRNPTEVAEALLTRSVCAVQVGACLVDGHGIFAWGWNHAGRDGMGTHAEDHCLSRANSSRLSGSTIYVAAERRRNGRLVTGQPCEDCQALLDTYGIIAWYRDRDGVWRRS